MRVICAVAVSACAALAGLLFGIVLVTKFVVLDEDPTARTALLLFLGCTVVFSVAARAAWRREP